MVGAILEVGLGKVTLDDFERVRDCGKRGAAGPTLPPNGLTLLEVRYRDIRKALQDQEMSLVGSVS